MRYLWGHHPTCGLFIYTKLSKAAIEAKGEWRKTKKRISVIGHLHLNLSLQASCVNDYPLGEYLHPFLVLTAIYRT